MGHNPLGGRGRKPRTQRRDRCAQADLRERDVHARFFLLLGGGGAYAAAHLGKNSVGTKQLKKNAVTTAKIKNEAVTAAKVKKGTLTGTQIDARPSGSVPSAQQATSAQQAGRPSGPQVWIQPENWHEVGAAGEPEFQNGWHKSYRPGQREWSPSSRTMRETFT